MGYELMRFSWKIRVAVCLLRAEDVAFPLCVFAALLAVLRTPVSAVVVSRSNAVPCLSYMPSLGIH